MTMRSGRIYKPTEMEEMTGAAVLGAGDSSAAQEGVMDVTALVHLLLEDRRRQQEELAAERHR